MPELDIFQEANRQLTICNACRYCEGYCALFRAIELRRDFTKGDVFYLANLCHDCRACYYACMYTPPHEFAVNVPQVMSEVRLVSYRHWSWPDVFGRAFTNPAIGFGLAGLAAGLVVVTAALFVAPARMFAVHRGPGSFYEVIPYLAMVIPAVTLFVFAMVIWLAGSIRFWWESGEVPGERTGFKALVGALRDALGLSNLQGGGPGCSYPEEQPRAVRRVYHSFVSWGFLSAFVSTTIAAIYQELFGWLPPYRLTSAPVIFGCMGGVAMIVGTAGLLWFKCKSDSAPAANGAANLDYIFLGILGLASLSGMLTLAFRSTSAMGGLLTIHLGLVAALFITAPYGKFVHFLYRTLALVKYHIEHNRSHS
jgi:citrate/tricarballylate utilization protein